MWQAPLEHLLTSWLDHEGHACTLFSEWTWLWRHQAITQHVIGFTLYAVVDDVDDSVFGPFGDRNGHHVGISSPPPCHKYAQWGNCQEVSGRRMENGRMLGISLADHWWSASTHRSEGIVGMFRLRYAGVLLHQISMVRSINVVIRQLQCGKICYRRWMGITQSTCTCTWNARQLLWLTSSHNP